MYWRFRASAAFLILTAVPLLPAQPVTPRAFLDRYCVSCHNQKSPVAKLALDSPDASNPPVNPELWERVIARLRARSMPPPGLPRPSVETYRTVAGALETAIDRAWLAHPNPRPAPPVQRLNRSEYNHAIRDLFALDIDLRPLLPGDETADGSFDNFADALSISTSHLERYLSVARQVTRLAVGLPPTSAKVERFEVPLHLLQDDRPNEALPLGSRGGIAIPYNFPVDGEYHIQVRLQRQYQEYLKGMGWPQTLDIRIDRKLIKRFTVGGAAKGRPAAASYAGDGEPGFAGDPEWETYMQLTGDAGLEVRVPVKAGPRTVSVSFVRELWEPEGLPQPLQRGRVITNDQVYMDYANVGSVQIGGPYAATGPAADTPSRRAIFLCHPAAPAEERPCASRILSSLASRAWRRPVTAADAKSLMSFYDTGRRGGGTFDSGIQFALESILTDPEFLLRINRGKPTGPELASRLSFFLWRSLPDPQLTAASRAFPAGYRAEVRRLLGDPRAADSLVNDFAAQWLNLRRVSEVVVDPDRYPNYDLSLIQAFQRETELFVAANIREDRPIPDLLNSDFTFVNERLARHYGIPGIYGSRFRRVTLPNLEQRGGLLAQGALLATTSYPDRTSPVLRGKWLLNNIFGLPVPPPPPGIDTNLEEASGGKPTSMRERLAKHRQNPSCNSCHSVIDPLGFALENFDVIGGWRTRDEAGRAVDSSGVTTSGDKVEGLTGLRALLLAEPEQFPRTVTEKLLAYALGRPLEFGDQPAVRKIVRDAASSGYRWSAIVQGIVESPLFLAGAPTPSKETATR